MARESLLGAIALCLALQAWLALVTEFNWDEFLYLSDIYSYQRGELTGMLQKLHVHLLGWLTSLPGDEIDQLEAGRLLMLACEAATCAFIYRLARTFFDPVPSLLAVLAFASAGFTIMHGSSFRADPLATALMMLSLATMARGRTNAVGAFLIAASGAVAALVTVKVIFYAPAFAGIAAWRMSQAEDRRRVLLWLVATALAAAFLFAALYVLQIQALPEASNSNAQAMLGNAGRTTILEAGLLPRAREIVRAAIHSPWQTAAMLFGVGALLVSAVRTRGGGRLRAVAILACAAPLLSLLFYRNAFPYFFPFILAPASLLVAWTVQEIWVIRSRPLLVGAAFTLPAMATALIWARERPQTHQQQLISAVHEIFPQPVRYIDRNGMISSFPKRGFFMSTWGMLNYRKGPPIFAPLLAGEPIPMLIVNSPSLEHAVGVRGSIARSIMLHEEDRGTLRRNYIPHWGPIWVAGQTHRIGPTAKRIAIAVPGPYTVEGATVLVDGQSITAGSVVALDRGHHILSAPEDAAVTLRWGRRLNRPPSVRLGSVYRGF